MAGHRGPDPEDPVAFPPDALPALRTAVQHVSWLLERGYRDTSALKLVGDHLQLSKRQRSAVRRCSCSDTELAARKARQVDAVSGPVAVDGFNALILAERALSGGVLLRGRDGALRDLGSVHGTWRAVTETPAAIGLVGDALAGCAVTWILDAPVSNSGRLAAALRAHDPSWTLEVVPQADPLVIAFPGTVVTSDGAILERCTAWCNLLAQVVAAEVPDAWIVDLADGAA